MSFTWLCYSFIISFICWKLFINGLSYYVKWVAVYLVLCWRSLTSEKPGVPIFASKREEILERPRKWTKEKTFRRDSMLVFAGGQDVWLLLEVARGRHNSAATRVRLQLGSDCCVYQTSDKDGGPRACEDWTTDCLSFQCLEPMRRWRIVFTGRLLCSNSSGQKESKLVQLNLIWAALCGPYHYKTSPDMQAITSTLAEQSFSHMQLNLDALGEGYEQWGSLWGTVSVDNSVTNIHASSLRRHCWKLPNVRARLDLVGVADNGTLFSVGYNFANVQTQFGHVRYADGRIEPVVGNSTVETAVVPKRFFRMFSSSCHNHSTSVVRCGFQQWGALHCASARSTLDSHQAVCLLLSWSKGLREDLPLLPLLTHSLLESDKLILTVDQPSCSNPAMVGGKGASLALLADVANTVLKNKVVVPPLFCLTVTAMQLQAQSSQALSSAVTLLDLISAGQKEGSLQEQCQHVVSAWLTVPLCAMLVASLSDRVRLDRSYAVRSSAVGEDAADTSSAGQNETVLGCVGLDSVIAAVHKCWASIYTFQSVQYRRQAGLAVKSLMGVVVQELVVAETAGIMFTTHPVTGDPSQLLITANYGLGETVVSGKVDPDTIVVNTDNLAHLVVQSTAVGNKDRRMVVTERGGVKTELLPDQLMECVCLSQPEVIALAQAGLCLQQLFGWPRDIEWAINKGGIYLLQCRPVTSLLAWSEEELTHELDSALLPGDATTTANTGEVLPGATSPLCQSTALRCADFTLMRSTAGVQHRMWYNNSNVTLSIHHAFLNVYNCLLVDAKQQASVQQKVIELAVCGHQISTPEMQRAASARSTPKTSWQAFCSFAIICKSVFTIKSSAKKAKKIGEEFKINCDSFTSSAALYTYLTDSYSHLLEAFRLHSQVSLASTMWQVVLFSMLAEGKSELSEENLQDIAKLLVGKQTVLSAQIPTDIKKLINIIKKCKNWTECTSLTPQQFSVWLENNSIEAATMLESIIQRYKHRNIKELDVMTLTWGLDSSPLLAMVQTMLRNTAVVDSSQQTRAEASTSVVDQLKSPRKPFTRTLIRLVVRLSGSAAECRELSKDASLRATHQLRCGYLRLAQLMLEEGRLPSSSLVFFLTHYEIGLLLRGPNPTLVHKALRRQRSWQKWDQLQFPEVMTSLPIPVPLNSHPLLLQKEYVQGTLVCAGSIRGRACVLLNCADSQALRAGDILVTRCTDVGWTPLFPLLAGVVTELGGLISHGAVVAREYGLPCVVGATNATLIFKTGDEIYLDGQSGRVQKISSPHNQETK